MESEMRDNRTNRRLIAVSELTSDKPLVQLQEPDELLAVVEEWLFTIILRSRVYTAQRMMDSNWLGEVFCQTCNVND